MFRFFGLLLLGSLLFLLPKRARSRSNYECIDLNQASSGPCSVYVCVCAGPSKATKGLVFMSNFYLLTYLTVRTTNGAVKTRNTARPILSSCLLCVMNDL